MKLSGKIITKEPIRSFTIKGEERKVLTAVIEEITSDRIRQQAAVEYWDKWADEFTYEVGQIIVTNCSINMECREHEGVKYYSNKIRGWGARLV